MRLALVTLVIVACAAQVSIADAQSTTTPTRAELIAHWAPRRAEHLDFVRPTAHRIDGGWVAASAVVIDIGFVIGWMAGIGEVGNCDPRCESWPLAFVPIGGGLASTLIGGRSHPSDGSVFGGFGIPSVLFQGVGLVMMLFSVGVQLSARLGHVPVVLAPAADGADVGATISIEI